MHQAKPERKFCILFLFFSQYIYILFVFFFCLYLVSFIITFFYFHLFLLNFSIYIIFLCYFSLFSFNLFVFRGLPYNNNKYLIYLFIVYQTFLFYLIFIQIRACD